MRQADLASFCRLARLKFLVYSPILYALGAVVGSSASGTAFKPAPFLHGLLLTYLAHLMTHFCNEYFDLEADRANQNPSPWTGGSRVLVEGALKHRTSLVAAIATLAIAVLLTLLMPGVLAPALAALIVLFAWFYSAPPVRLQSLGLGEATVVLVLNLLVPMLGCALQASRLPREIIGPLLPLALIEFARMMVMNMADVTSDAIAGKKTLIVRIGLSRAVKVNIAVLLLAYLSVPPALFLGMPRLSALMFALTLPLALLQGTALCCRQAIRPDMPFISSTLNGLSAVAVFMGLMFQSRRLVDRSAALLLMYPVVVYAAVFVAGSFQKLRRETGPGGAAVVDPGMLVTERGNE